jgi:hypothetical protein
MSAKLSKSWPPTARHILLDAARYFYRQMNEQFAVYDAAMDDAIEWANREMEARQKEIYEEASSRWINRWESGKLDAEMRRAIDEMYGRLRRGERSIRPRSRVQKKTPPAQLNADIARVLAKRTS